jgi:protein-S-isoprenylcysteine O-methyltransferase Ste14
VDDLDGKTSPRPARALPTLGPRGEGWVALQMALIALAALAGLKGPRWRRRSRWPRLVCAIPLALTGAGLMAGGSRRLGAQLTPFPKPRDEGTLRQDGAYGLVRHPIYGGVLLLAWAWALVSSPLAILPAALAEPFFEAKRRREEAWLVEQHADYEEYRRRVPRRFVPFLW